ncbi:MAG: DNA-formamidopyrimidine glycosylase family protein [Actinomycetota bacterium]
MPEGHTIHRYARLHRKTLGGVPLAVSSPQGRFAQGAALLDGHRIDEVDAVGKHLFYHWSNGQTLHVHLGLFGKFKTFRNQLESPRTPTAGTRLAMSTGDEVVHLAGPTACDLVTPDEQESILSRLGPDPLGSDADYDRFATALRRRRIPLGAALLDQKVIAGIGNVYRSEIPFLAGIDPRRPANEVDEDEAALLWKLVSQELKRGEKSGRIVTVEPSDVGATRRSQLTRANRVYAYKRTGEPCFRCPDPISMVELANRKAWWCPTCQPR